MRLYAEETAPLAALYRDRGILHAVDGMGSVEEVTARIEQALTAAQRARSADGPRPTA